MRLANALHQQTDTCNTGQEALARATAVRLRRNRLFVKPSAIAPKARVFPEISGPITTKIEMHPFCFDVLRQVQTVRPGIVKEFPKIAEVQDAFCKHTHFTKTEIISHRHDAPLVHARHLVIALCKKLTPKSLPEIGRCFDRDHTTILYVCRKMQPLMNKLDVFCTSKSLDEIIAAAWVLFLSEYKRPKACYFPHETRRAEQ